MKDPLKVMVLGRSGSAGLEGSYSRAFEELGCRVIHWDMNEAIKRYTRLGKVGEIFNSFVPVETWVRKANRELFLSIKDERPDVVLGVGNQQLQPGTIAQIKLSIPDTRLILVWPDTLLNLDKQVIDCLPVYDLIACYSQRAIPMLERFGASAIEWVPFAADPLLHPKDVSISSADRQRFKCDVVFIGNYRPERERTILSLVDAGYCVKVWGADSWRKKATEPSRTGEYWQGGQVVGEDFVRALRCASLSLNLIDPTNFPAANMRFFESLACGVATLHSNCPEMVSQFPDQSITFYFSDAKNLLQRIRDLLSDEKCRRAVAKAGYELVIKEHTYVHRARQILKRLLLEARLTTDNGVG